MGQSEFCSNAQRPGHVAGLIFWVEIVNQERPLFGWTQIQTALQTATGGPGQFFRKRLNDLAMPAGEGQRPVPGTLRLPQIESRRQSGATIFQPAVFDKLISLDA